MAPAGTDQLAQRQLNLPARECDRLSRWTRRGNRLGRAAAQHRPDAGQQFARVERLRQIIVRAHLKPDDAVDLFALRGQHDDRDRRRGAQAPAQAQAVLARQHQVEHDQVDPALGQRPVHLAPVARDRDAAFVGAQILGHQRADLAVVLDDEDVGVDAMPALCRTVSWVINIGQFRCSQFRRSRRPQEPRSSTEGCAAGASARTMQVVVVRSAAWAMLMPIKRLTHAVRRSPTKRLMSTRSL